MLEPRTINLQLFNDAGTNVNTTLGYTHSMSFLLLVKWAMQGEGWGQDIPAPDHLP